MHNTHDPIGVLNCGALQCDGVSSVYTIPLPPLACRQYQPLDILPHFQV